MPIYTFSLIFNILTYSEKGNTQKNFLNLFAFKEHYLIIFGFIFGFGNFNI